MAFHILTVDSAITLKVRVFRLHAGIKAKPPVVPSLDPCIQSNYNPVIRAMDELCIALFIDLSYYFDITKHHGGEGCNLGARFKM